MLHILERQPPTVPHPRNPPNFSQSARPDSERIQLLSSAGLALGTMETNFLVHFPSSPCSVRHGSSSALNPSGHSRCMDLVLCAMGCSLRIMERSASFLQGSMLVGKRREGAEMRRALSGQTRPLIIIHLAHRSPSNRFHIITLPGTNRHMQRTRPPHGPRTPVRTSIRPE